MESQHGSLHLPAGANNVTTLNDGMGLPNYYFYGGSASLNQRSNRACCQHQVGWLLSLLNNITEGERNQSSW